MNGNVGEPLRVTSLFKRFKEKRVLQNVSLCVEVGEIFGLVGLNGVGKTTLIKIILDLLRADSGAASFFGRSVSQPEGRRNLAYLPEKFYPSPFLKGSEFLEISQAFYRKRFNRDAAISLAKALDLDPRVLDHKISKYSKGMGQKLGLLSVFLSEAPLLLLDEPMSGLDPSARIQLKELLLRYKSSGNTIFFTSHILSDIEELCDNISVLHDAEIIYNGAPKTFVEEQGERNLERAFLKAISASVEAA